MGIAKGAVGREAGCPRAQRQLVRAAPGRFHGLLVGLARPHQHCPRPGASIWTRPAISLPKSSTRPGGSSPPPGAGVTVRTESCGLPELAAPSIRALRRDERPQRRHRAGEMGEIGDVAPRSPASRRPPAPAHDAAGQRRDHRRGWPAGRQKPAASSRPGGASLSSTFQLGIRLQRRLARPSPAGDECPPRRRH